MPKQGRVEIKKTADGEEYQAEYDNNDIRAVPLKYRHLKPGNPLYDLAIRGLKMGLYVKTVAGWLGIDTATIYKAAKKYPELAEALYEKGNQTKMGILARVINKAAIEDNLSAQIYYLNRIANAPSKVQRADDYRNPAKFIKLPVVPPEWVDNDEGDDDEEDSEAELGSGESSEEGSGDYGS